MMKVTLIDLNCVDKDCPLGVVYEEEIESIHFTQNGCMDMLTSYGYHILVEVKNIIAITAV